MTTTLFIQILATLSIFTEGNCKLRIEPLLGDAKTGEFSNLNSDGTLRFRSENGEETIPLEDVARLVPIRNATASPPAIPEPARTVFFHDKSTLAGKLVPAQGNRRVALLAGLDGPVEFSLDTVAAIRLAITPNADAERELQARIAEPPRGKDLLLVIPPSDKKPVLIPGALERITPEEWEFSLGRKVRKSPLDAAYAVILAARAGVDAALPATVEFAAKNRLAGRIRSADSSSLMLECAAGPVQIPWRAIDVVSLRSDRVVYLVDLDPVKSESRSFLNLGWPAKKNLSVTGTPLVIRGKTFETGLGVHAYCALTYRLDRRYERFSALVGIDDSVGQKGSAIFRVITDGKIAFESKTLRGGDEPISISVSLDGVETLTLECDPADSLDLADHADWARAILYRARSRDVR